MIETHPVKAQLKGVGYFLALLAIIEVINLVTGRFLNQLLGNEPRTVQGLLGIVFSPFLHGGLLHFFSNLIPLGIFTFLALQYGTKRFAIVTLWLIVVSGILVWLMARNADHIGASGLVYGYFGFLLLAGFINRSAKMMLISVGIGIFYGGLIFGVLPSRPYISWESHLFGFIAGLIAAKLWAKNTN